MASWFGVVLNFLGKDDNWGEKLRFIAFFLSLLLYGILEFQSWAKQWNFLIVSREYVEINDYLVSRHRQTLLHTNSILFVLL